MIPVSLVVLLYVIGSAAWMAGREWQVRHLRRQNAELRELVREKDNALLRGAGLPEL